MTRTIRETKVEYGDFQTPLELATRVCQKLIELGVSPDVIVEPTCGVGNFIDAAANLFQATSKIIGVEINQNYLQAIRSKHKFLQDRRNKTWRFFSN